MGKLDCSEQTCYREVLLTRVQHSSLLIVFLLCVPFSSCFLSPFSMHGHILVQSLVRFAIPILHQAELLNLESASKAA